MELIIITGLSGAGKSQAVHCLEDLGYYCVDNMPPMLMSEFVTLAENASQPIDKAAFVVDIRGGQFFGELKDSLRDLEGLGIEYKIMYLEASDNALIRRFKETRRNHPLAGNGSISKGIAKEREMLADLKKMASFVIDTTSLKAAGLNAEIKNVVLANKTDTFSIKVMSFGFKNGIPSEADFIFDARFIPNPFYVASLKKLTGNNKKVRDYVMQFEESQTFVTRMSQTISDIIPCFIREGKYHLVVACGCTGGRHRSVAIANEIALNLGKRGRHVILQHRDL